VDSACKHDIAEIVAKEGILRMAENTAFRVSAELWEGEGIDADGCTGGAWTPICKHIHVLLLSEIFLVGNQNLRRGMRILPP